jgi:hypothetical protein
MISDRVKRLLAGAIDGDLNRRQRRAFEQALEQSPEALELYRGMQEDARRIRLMPRAKPPVDFASQVLQAIEPTIVTVPARIAQTAQHNLSLWANMAAAAAVLLAVSVGTYLVVILNNQQKLNPDVAERPVVASSTPSIVHPENARPAPEVVRRSAQPDAETVESLPMPREEIVAAVPMQESTDPNEQAGAGVLTVPFSPSLNLFKVDMPKLPPILLLRDLDQSAQRSIMIESVKGEDACHIDLFCKDANKEFERVQAALRAQGKRTIVETLAQQRLQARMKTSFVFFAESMTADDIAKLFTALAIEERRIDAKQLDKVVLTSFSPNNQKTLATLLGVDPKQLSLKSKAATPIDPQKPISDSTADKVAKAITEKDKSGASARAGDHVVIGLSYNPIRQAPALSKEVREFLNLHKERRPGTVALMLVIRNFD